MTPSCIRAQSANAASESVGALGTNTTTFVVARRSHGRSGRPRAPPQVAAALFRPVSVAGAEEGGPPLPPALLGRHKLNGAILLPGLSADGTRAAPVAASGARRGSSGPFLGTARCTGGRGSSSLRGHGVSCVCTRGGTVFCFVLFFFSKKIFWRFSRRRHTHTHFHFNNEHMCAAIDVSLPRSSTRRTTGCSSPTPDQLAVTPASGQHQPLFWLEGASVRPSMSHPPPAPNPMAALITTLRAQRQTGHHREDIGQTNEEPNAETRVEAGAEVDEPAALQSPLQSSCEPVAPAGHDLQQHSLQRASDRRSADHLFSIAVLKYIFA